MRLHKAITLLDSYILPSCKGSGLYEIFREYYSFHQ